MRIKSAFSRGRFATMVGGAPIPFEASHMRVVRMRYDADREELGCSVEWGAYDMIGAWHRNPDVPREEIGYSAASTPRQWERMGLARAMETMLAQAAVEIVETAADDGMVRGGAVIRDEAGNGMTAKADESPADSKDYASLAGQYLRAGTVVSHGGKSYRLLSPLVASDRYAPPEPSLWREYRTPTAEGGEPVEWRQPIDQHDAYMTGDGCLWDGRRYVSLIDYNVWSPEGYPQGWKELADGGGATPEEPGNPVGGEPEEPCDQDGGGEPEQPAAPEWRQPTGAHDAYRAGDRVTHEGREWASDIGGNVWEPGVYGWKAVD